MFDGVIIYSSYFPNKESIFRGLDFLKKMESDFYNYVIFVGIQQNTIDEWVELLNEYQNKGLKIFFGFCEEKLVVNSDVSGFQKALHLFKENKIKLKIKKNSSVWFGHSKGVTTNRMEYHEWVLKNFWDRKIEIETKLYSETNYGTYGYHISFIPNYEKSNIVELWKDYSSLIFKKPVLNYMFVNTFYVIKSEILDTLLNNINQTFFSEKIKGINGIGDRYFFERDFIHIVDLLGYEPIFEEFSPNTSWTSVNTDEYNKNLLNWKNYKI